MVTTKVRMPRLTIAMCEEKIAQLEQELEHLCDQRDAALHLTIGQVMSLMSLLHGARDYIEDHSCVHHAEAADAIVEDCETLMECLNNSALDEFGSDAFEEAVSVFEAEAMLANMPTDAVKN